MFCTFCACAKGQFLIKTQFYDLIRFISIDSMFVPNLERVGPSSQIKDTKYHFFLKVAKYPCLNSPECCDDIDSGGQEAVHNHSD